MGYKIVKLELIKKEKARMLTFRKRKANLLKKASEFSILCGVDACVIVFAPEHKNQPIKPEIWPSNPDEVVSIINKYKGSDQPRRSCNVSDYFADKKKKAEMELVKLQNQSWKAKYSAWDNRLNKLSEDQLRVVLQQLDAKLEVVGRKLDRLKQNQNVMDNASSWMKISSQLGNYSTELQHFLNLKPLDIQLLKQSSHLTPLSSGLVEKSPVNNSTNLQLFSDAKPLNVQQPVYFQPWQVSRASPVNANPIAGLMTKMLNDQNNNSNQFAGMYNSFSHNGLPYHNPAPWMWDNLMLNTDSSMFYAATPVQQFMQRPEFLAGSIPYQIHCTSQYQFNGNIELESEDQNWKWMSNM